MAQQPNGGLLHELRKKTMQKIVKYAAAPVTSPTAVTGSAGSSGRAILSPRAASAGKSPAERLQHRIQRFEEHDELLRGLETQLTDMLQHLQASCVSMGRVVELFTQTFRYDHGAYQMGVDYLAAMKMVRREGAHLMEQAIRFTVLDPLSGRLERHDGIKARIGSWRRVVADVEELQLSLDFLRATRQDKEDKRQRAEAKLAGLRAQLDDQERELFGLLDDATNGSAIRHQTDLFTTMRLQLAVFFYQTNNALFSRLSETEAEIVVGIGPQLSPRHEPALDLPELSRRERDSKATTLTASSYSDPSSSTDAEDKYYEELRISTITLDDFEAGRSSLIAEPAPDASACISPPRGLPGIGQLPVPDLLALASNPVLEQPQGDGDDDSADDAPEIHHGSHGSQRRRSPRSHASHRRSQPDESMAEEQRHHPHPSTGTRQTSTTTPGPSRESGVFSSLRRSFKEKFSSPKAAASMASQAKVTAVTAVGASGVTKHKVPSRLPFLTSSEWRGVEGCLWELDTAADEHSEPRPRTRSQGHHQRQQHESLSRWLAHDDKGLFAMTGFLRVEDLARLAKVDRRLHQRLSLSPAPWKRSIRLGGLGPVTRSAVWLGMLYGGTPWRSGTATPHHLCSGEMRKRIYENLLVKLGARLAEGLVRDVEASDDDRQLIAWLHEIDVDVARTCNKDIYAQDVAEEWDAVVVAPATDSAAAGATDSGPSEASMGTLVASALLRDAAPDLHQHRRPPPRDHPNRRRRQRTELEAKIRRVLRAYVMYNPRVGYCQGMNFLVRLLMEVADDEADGFWLFVGLSEPEADRNLYEPGLAVLQPLFTRFEAVLAGQKPELWDHFQREGVPVAAFAARWFLTFFSTFETFGPTLVIRILDHFVVDGWRIIFSMGLVVLDELEEQLLEADMEAILRILQFPRGHLPEPDHGRRRQLLQHALTFSITRVMHDDRVVRQR